MEQRKESLEAGGQRSKAEAPRLEAEGAPPQPAEVRAPGREGNATESGGVEALRQKVIAAIQEVYDPEIPVNIWELGLVYEIEIHENRDVTVQMTLTSPACPAAQELPVRVRGAVGRVAEVGEVDVQIVWDPPWTPAKMSEIAKLELGMF